MFGDFSCFLKLIVFKKQIQNLQTISVGFEDLCFEVLVFDVVFCFFAFWKNNNFPKTKSNKNQNFQTKALGLSTCAWDIFCVFLCFFLQNI